MATDAENAVIRTMYSKDLLSQEVIRRQIREVVSELAGPNPTAIERMLARRAALCWVAVNFAETTFANSLSRGTTLSQSDHNQRRLDRAHRRLLSSLKTLAAVRRVPLTAVQVNVGALNVGGSEPAPRASVCPVESTGLRSSEGFPISDGEPIP